MYSSWMGLASVAGAISGCWAVGIICTGVVAMILEMARGEVQGREELKQGIETAIRDSKCLVIFQDEPNFRGRLEEVLGKEVVLVPFGERLSGILSGGLRDELHRLSRMTLPLSLIFVGHSGIVDEVTQASGSLEPGYDRWVDGVKRVERQLQEAKALLAKHVQSLLDQISLSGNEFGGRVQFQAVFYHAAAGLFLDYDWELNEFRPLLES
jgi:hypothetical protein